MIQLPLKINLEIKALSINDSYYYIFFVIKQYFCLNNYIF